MGGQEQEKMDEERGKAKVPLKISGEVSDMVSMEGCECEPGTNKEDDSQSRMTSENGPSKEMTKDTKQLTAKSS